MPQTTPENTKRIVPILWETAGCFLCGLIFACAELGGISSPIPVAAASCVGPIGAVSTLIGALVTGMIAQSFPEQLVLILSLMLAACVRVILREYRSDAFVSITAASCVLAAGVVISVSQGNAFGGVLTYIMSALLTGASAYFLNIVLEKMRLQKKIPLQSSVGCAAAVVYFVLIAALSSFQFSLINPGCILGIAVTLLAAQRFRYIGGVICGALTTCGALLSGDEIGFSLIFLPVTGLLAGYITDSGSLITSGVFFLFNALAQLTIHTGAVTYTSIGNLLLGCITYLLLHTVCIDQWIVIQQPSSSRMMQNMSVRMRFMAESIGSVRSDTERIAKLLAQTANASTVPAKVTAAVCRNCPEQEQCWQKNAVRTHTGFRKMQVHAMDERRAFPQELAACGHKELLTRVFIKEQKRLQIQKAKIAQKEECRRLLYEQMLATEEMLSSFGDSMAVAYSSELTDAIERRLERYGYICDSVVAYYNDRERLMIEFYCKDKQLEECMAAICHILTEMLGVTLEELEPVGTKESVRYRLCEATPYYLECSSSKRCAEGGISGDTTVQFRDGAGGAYVVLSDGMGTGKSAAVESRMTAEMFRKLISSGISHRSALRMLNGLMLTKSERESFATLDAARFDLDSGEMTILKSGAASSLLRQGDEVVRICAPTFPIGSGASPDVFTAEFTLQQGDMLVLLSDGILEEQYPFIKELLLQSDDPERIADEICQKSLLFSGGRCLDDVSVTVVQICSR